MQSAIKSVPHWDLEYDVVVAGFGFAGGVAAIEAHDHGAKVLLIEKEEHSAGCSPASGGWIACVSDVDKAFTYFRALCGGRTPDDVVLAFCKQALSTPDYVRKLAQVSGAQVKVVMHNEERMGTFDLPGREATAAVAVNHVPGFTNFSWKPGKPTNGARTIKVLMDNLKVRNVPVLYSTPARELVTDAIGNVIGLVAEQQGQRLTVKARRAVILATGGFEQSEELRKQYLQGTRFVSMCHPSNTGDGIRMAQKVGAGLWHMWHIHGSYGFSFPELGNLAIRHNQGVGPSGRYGRETQMVWIVVDKRGQRYMNEYPPMPADLSHRPMEQLDANLLLSPHYREGGTGYPRIPSWLVFDEAGRKLKPIGGSAFSWSTYSWSMDNSEEIERGWILAADSLTALADKIRSDPDNDGLMDACTLERTVARWNEIVAAGGIDADFLRGRQSMFGPIAQAPFYAVKVWPIITNTQGGPAHNALQQVLDSYGRPVPRLYAVGELGSLAGHIYDAVGVNIGECFTSGRIAGQTAALETPWEGVG